MKQVFREWADASADYELSILTAEVPIDTFLGLQERALAARVSRGTLFEGPVITLFEG